MQRKELTKAIKKYANKTNFKKYGLIRKFIKRENALIQRELDTIDKYSCPKCGSKNLEVESTDDEYNMQTWSYCDKCDYDFDLPYEYYNAINELNAIGWCDDIILALSFEKPDLDSYE